MSIQTPSDKKRIEREAAKLAAGEADQRFVVYLTEDDYNAIEVLRVSLRVKSKKKLFLMAMARMGAKVSAE